MSCYLVYSISNKIQLCFFRLDTYNSISSDSTNSSRICFLGIFGRCLARIFGHIFQGISFTLKIESFF